MVKKMARHDPKHAHLGLSAVVLGDGLLAQPMQNQGRGLGHSGSPAQQLKHALVKGAAPICGNRWTESRHGEKTLPD
jgi:hypothetical protein